jgi:hypothetical protein
MNGSFEQAFFRPSLNLVIRLGYEMGGFCWDETATLSTMATRITALSRMILGLTVLSIKA